MVLLLFFVALKPETASSGRAAAVVVEDAGYLLFSLFHPLIASKIFCRTSFPPSP